MLRRLPHTRSLAGVALLLLWLSGCSHTLPREELPANLPDQVELTDTPFYPQERYQCGPASLAMVMQQRGIVVTPEALVSRVYLPQRHGSVAPEMVATARSYGMLVYELPASMDALLREVAAGNPVLVLQNLGLSWMPKWHYAVVVGYDLAAQQITLRSGLIERHRISFGLFDRTWQRGRRWGIVLLQPGELPASDNPLGYLRAAYALEQTQQYDAAMAAYRSATRRWPGREVTWLAYSNLAYRQGHYAEAEQTLREAQSFHPRSAKIWNNLAYALAGEGCRDGAMIAVECSIRLAPQVSEYLQSRDELLGLTWPPKGDCRPLSCPAVAP